MVGVIAQEVIHKKELLGPSEIQTIYFGGGSPSFIEAGGLAKILISIHQHFHVSEKAEITIECNPDDIDQTFAQELTNLGFNRISLGVQSFFDSDLKMLNRAHSSNQANEAIELLQNSGFNNITLDLIYGLPGSSMKKWERNIQQALALNVPHISSYCLTIEDKTLLKHQIEKGVLKEISESDQLKQYKLLVKSLEDKGYEHYEISNFALPGFRSKHNSSYWQNKDYLGLGPSAHSKIGQRRFWNISNNNQFIKRFKTDKKYWEEEILTEKDMFNELIMIGLRMKEGLDLKQLRDFSFFESDFLPELKKLVENGKIKQENERIHIIGKNKFIADTIISDLFIV